MDYRFIKETDNKGSSIYFTESLHIEYWSYVGNSFSIDYDTAMKFFKELDTLIEPKKEVLIEKTI